MDSVLQSIKDLGRVKLGIMVGVAVALTALFIFVALRLSTPAMTTLYSNLPTEDSAQIVEQLEQAGTKYELRNNGTQILVPSDKVLRLRLSLAQEGIPSGGSVVGYEIFDRTEALGTSNFVMNVNMMRALEGELSRTIASLSQIESARVHLVIPKRELFTRDKQDPTASVALKLKGGELEKQEIRSIQNLVATAVPGLKPERITIVDSKGRLLAKGAGDESDQSSDAQEYRINYETRMRGIVEGLLERSLGIGKAKVQINADVDFDRIVRNSETFDPESQVARSVQTNEERENANERNVKDNVSVANNLPNPPQASEDGTVSTRNTEKNEETTNYEISKVVENHIKEMGTVKRLSVAVLVDGIYSTNADGEPVYNPRTPQELAQIDSLVRSAVGFDDKRGDKVEVVNMRFSPETELALGDSPLDWLKDSMQGIIQTLVLGGVAILAILLVVRPLVNRIIESTSPTPALAGIGPDGMPLVGGPGGPRLMGDDEDEEDEGVDIDRIKGRVKSSMYRKINELVEKHPDETMTIIRQWVFKE